MLADGHCMHDSDVPSGVGRPQRVFGTTKHHHQWIDAFCQENGIQIVHTTDSPRPPHPPAHTLLCRRFCTDITAVTREAAAVPPARVRGQPCMYYRQAGARAAGAAPTRDALIDRCCRGALCCVSGPPDVRQRVALCWPHAWECKCTSQAWPSATARCSGGRPPPVVTASGPTPSPTLAAATEAAASAAAWHAAAPTRSTLLSSYRGCNGIIIITLRAPRVVPRPKLTRAPTQHRNGSLDLHEHLMQTRLRRSIYTCPMLPASTTAAGPPETGPEAGRTRDSLRRGQQRRSRQRVGVWLFGFGGDGLTRRVPPGHAAA